MAHTSLLTRAEIERLGPPVPEELSETGVPVASLCDLALRVIAILPDQTTTAVADYLGLPRVLTEELLQLLYREKLVEVRGQAAMGASRYAMLERGWERINRLQSVCGYTGPAPVTLADYTHMTQLQAVPVRPATIDGVRAAMSDLVLPDSLLQTLGYVVGSRRSLFLTGPRARVRRPSQSGSTPDWMARFGFRMPSKSTGRLSASSMLIRIARWRRERRSLNTTGAGCESGARWLLWQVN